MLEQGFSEINATYFILTPLLLIYFSFSLFTLILSISFSFQWSSHLWLKPFQWFILLKNLKGKHLEKSKMKFPFPISFFLSPGKTYFSTVLSWDLKNWRRRVGMCPLGKNGSVNWGGKMDGSDHSVSSCDPKVGVTVSLQSSLNLTVL